MLKENEQKILACFVCCINYSVSGNCDLSSSQMLEPIHGDSKVDWSQYQTCCKISQTWGHILYGRLRKIQSNFVSLQNWVRKLDFSFKILKKSFTVRMSILASRDPIQNGKVLKVSLFAKMQQICTTPWWQIPLGLFTSWR